MDILALLISFLVAVAIFGLFLGLFSGVGIRKTTGNHGGTSVIGSGSAVLDPHDRRDEVGRVRAGIRAV